ncbi:MAG: squalene synthase HpnC [Oxalobacter sp.]|nr:MAG: squalene synthase HpnC [Oxalobacter sp.]
MAVDHYENFPVASFLLPKHLRPAVQAIYAFARSADDIADEGAASDEARLAALRDYDAALNRIANGEPSQSSLFLSLEKVIHAYRLPLQPFHDLLSAFMQDVTTKRYPNFDTLIDYCRRSANPVGTLMLHLYGEASERNLRDSDAICTSLQLINFWQDVAIDWQKNRVYLPQEDLLKFQVSESLIDHATVNDDFRNLMRFEVHRARDLMHSGAALPHRLPGRIGWELRLVVQGGFRILEKIESVNYDIFRNRPKLKPRDWCVMGWRTMKP